MSGKYILLGASCSNQEPSAQGNVEEGGSVATQRLVQILPIGNGPPGESPLMKVFKCFNVAACLAQDDYNALQGVAEMMADLKRQLGHAEEAMGPKKEEYEVIWRDTRSRLCSIPAGHAGRTKGLRQDGAAHRVAGGGAALREAHALGHGMYAHQPGKCTE